MKKILFAAMAALAITSCSQNEEIEAPAKKAEINFKSVVGKTSRAAEADNTTLQTNGFTLYAYNTKAVKMADVQTGGLATTFINGKTATYSSSNWAVAEGPYYWPINENIQFFAYSPTGGVTNYVTTGTYPSFTYTLQTPQVDMLAAATLDQNKKDAATTVGAVELTFNHILTQINFQLQGKDTGFKYTVSKIELTGVANSGAYTYSSNGGAWTAQAGTEKYTYDATYTEIDGTASATIATKTNALMLIPNGNLASTKIEVTYTTTKDGSTVFSGTKEAALGNSTWDIGKKILYTLTLPSGAEELTISTEVGSWTEDNPADSTEPTDPTTPAA